jgi:LysR family glycine cleavage system transcriptional activator
VRQALSTLQWAFPPAEGRTVARLVVSAHPSLANQWLIPSLSGFTARHPGIDVDIRSTADLDDFLDAGVDVTLRYGAGGWPNANDVRLRRESLFPACSPQYRDLFSIAKPQDLARCTLIRHAWQPWAPWFTQARVRLAEPASGLKLSDNGMALEAAASGQGVVLARSLLIKRYLASGRLVRLFDVEVEDVHAYFLAWRVGTRLTAAAEAFRDWAREAMQAP